MHGVHRVLRTNAMVSHVDDEGVSVGADPIPTRTVFWAAGNQASPLVKALNAPSDRAGARLLTMEDGARVAAGSRAWD